MLKINTTKLNKEITDLYSVENDTFIAKETKNEFNKFETEIGDVLSGDFQPQVKIKRWDNECNFSVRLIDDEPTKPIIETEGNKIKFIKKDREAHFYDIENGFEFEVLLKKKPKTNKVQMSIETKGLKFYPQPALTEEFKNGYSEEFKKEIIVTETDVKDLEGNILIHRPIEIVNSFAVYHESKAGDYHKMGGKNYMAGKAFHIYRPKIIDSAGKEVWGELNITDNLLTVEIPQGFLDNAVYPVIVDPTFGKTGKGGSEYNGTGYLGADEATLTEDGTATKITIYLRNASASNAYNARAGLYDEGLDDKAEDLLQDSGDVSIAASYDAEKDFDITDEVLTAADYWLVMNLENDNLKFYYDSGGRIQENISYGYGALPATFPDSGVLNYVRTIYCTYTAGGADHTQTCSDAITFATTIIKDVIKKKSLSLPKTDTISTMSAFSLSKVETLDYATSLAHSNVILLSDIVQVAESLVKDLNVTYSDAFSFVEDISKYTTFNKLFSQTLSITENSSNRINVIIQMSLDIIESSTRKISSRCDVSDLISFTESISTTFNLTSQEAFTLIDNALIIMNINRVHSETLLLIDSLQNIIGLTSQEALEFIDSLTILKSKKITDELAFAETLSKYFELSASSAISLAENFATQSIYSKTFSETLELLENLQTQYNLSKVEAIIIVDAMTIISGSSQSVNEILSINDSFNSQISIFKQETLNIIETSTSLISFLRIISDIVALLDSSRLRQEKTFSEVLSIVESLQGMTESKKSLTEILSIVATYSQLTSKTLADTINFVDTFIKHLDKLQQDNLSIDDNIIHTSSLLKTESIVIDESIVKKIDLSKVSSFTITEISSIISSFSRELTELLEISEDKTIIQDKIETIHDEIIIAEIIRKTTCIPIDSTLVIVDEMSILANDYEIDISDIVQMNESHSFKYSAIIVDDITLIEAISKYSSLKVLCNEDLSIIDNLVLLSEISLEDILELIDVHSTLQKEPLFDIAIAKTQQKKAILIAGKNKTILFTK